MNIEKELPGVKENVLLKDYTSFKIGGKARYFFVAKTKKDILKAILVAKKFNPVRDYRDDEKAQRKQISNGVNLPFFILGSGSNLLVSDVGFDGLVIKIQDTKYKILNTKIMVGAGTMLGKLVSATTNAGLTGFEWATGIPGTVGGAIAGNAGAFGKSMADIAREVEIAEITRVGPVQIRKFKNKDCKFGYRDSIFKRNKNLIILSVEFQFKKGKKAKIKDKIKEYLNYRRENQPLNFPSAGSVFKNPSPAQISKKFVVGKGFFAGRLKSCEPRSFGAGELIEKCGLKGKTIGKAKISEKHANFIVNLGGAKAKDVIKLIKLAKQKVKKKFRIVLEEEIQYLGFQK